jgi:hypothetical protein
MSPNVIAELMSENPFCPDCEGGFGAPCQCPGQEMPWLWRPLPDSYHLPTK